MQTRPKLDYVLKQLVFPIPEDLYDMEQDNNPEFKQIELQNSEHWIKIANILSDPSSKDAQYLVQKVGILQVNLHENKIVVSPKIYGLWIEENHVKFYSPNERLPAKKSPAFKRSKIVIWRAVQSA